MPEDKWTIREFLEEIDEAIEVGLDRGAIVIQGRAQLNLSRPGTPSSKTGLKNFNRAKSVYDGGSVGAFGRYRKLSKRARTALRQVRAVRDLGGFIDAPGGMPRKRTGTLARSIVIESGKRRARKVGPDKSVPYAAIHEYGGTISSPGGQPYVVLFGQAVFVKKGSAAATKPHTKFTKPHKIVMPARPYMRPSLDQTRAQVADEFADTIASVFTERAP